MREGKFEEQRRIGQDLGIRNQKVEVCHKFNKDNREIEAQISELCFKRHIKSGGLKTPEKIVPLCSVGETEKLEDWCWIA